jgi:cytochrome c5
MKLAIIGITTLATLCSIGQVAAADGKAVYDKSCAVCHKGALPKAPKLGDKKAWAPLIARGSKDLVASVIKGKPPLMPPKGGAANEEDVAAAVEYMISAAK